MDKWLGGRIKPVVIEDAAQLKVCRQTARERGSAAARSVPAPPAPCKPCPVQHVSSQNVPHSPPLLRRPPPSAVGAAAAGQLRAGWASGSSRLRDVVRRLPSQSGGSGRSAPCRHAEPPRASSCRVRAHVPRLPPSAGGAPFVSLLPPPLCHPPLLAAQALVYSKKFELVICDEAHRLKACGVVWCGVVKRGAARRRAGRKVHSPCSTPPSAMPRLPPPVNASSQNGQSKINQAIGGLPCRLRLLLTGTPIQNDLSGVWQRRRVGWGQACPAAATAG